MKFLIKSALTWMAVIVVVAVFFTVRYQMIQGLFSSLPVAPSSTCRAIAAGLKDPADLAADTLHDTIFVAASDRQAAKPYSNPRDGLYVLKLSDPAAPPVKLAGPPADFHPYGISLYHDGANETLAVIDRKSSGRHLVEIYSVNFDADVPKLTQQTAIQGGLLVSPSGIAAISAQRFYISNDRVTKNPVGRFAEDYLLWPHADVMAYNGMAFRIAAQRIAYPAGLLAQNGLLYAVAANERSIRAYVRQDITGELADQGSLSLPARPDKITADPAGNLIVAGQTRPGSSQVFRLRLGNDGAPVSYETLFSDDGHRLRGASAAAFAAGQLFIGASDDDKMLACRL